MPRPAQYGVLPVVMLLAALVAGCGGGGSSGSFPRPSRSVSLAPSRSVPTVSRPTSSEASRPARPTSGPTTAEPTSAPTRTAPATTTPTKTAPPKTKPTQTKPTSAEPTPTPSESTPSAAPTSAAPQPSASTAPAATADTTGDDDGTPSGWWWVLLAAVIAGLVTVLLLVRRARARTAWDAELGVAQDEVAWFGRDLVPALRGSGSFASVSGGWAVAAPRVQALEDTLTGLATTAPTDDRGARAATVQDAVRTARERMAALLVAGEGSQWSLALDEVQAPLLAALVPPRPADGAAAV